MPYKDRKEEKSAYDKRYYATHKEEKSARAKIYYKTHRLELLADSRAYKETHKEQAIIRTKIRKKEIDAYQKEYRKTHKKEKRVSEKKCRIKRKHGITAEDYDKMFSEQNGICTICGKPPREGKRLCIDHNHDTGEIRGLLCYGCNFALGLFHDSMDNLTKAKKYLELHKGETHGIST